MQSHDTIRNPNAAAPTPAEIQQQAEDFLRTCVLAARSYIRLADPYQACVLLENAELWIEEWHRLMEERLLADTEVEQAFHPRSTAQLFRR